MARKVHVPSVAERATANERAIRAAAAKLAAQRGVYLCSQRPAGPATPLVFTLSDGSLIGPLLQLQRWVREQNTPSPASTVIAHVEGQLTIDDAL